MADNQRALGIAALIGGVALAGLGVGLVVASRRKGTVGALGKGPGPNALVSETTGQDGKVTKAYLKRKIPIEQRVGIMQQHVAKAVKNPEMRKLALAITGKGGTVKFGTRTILVKGANCPPRDGLCEWRAIYDWKRQYLRYTGDVAPHVLDKDDTGGQHKIEAVDLFQSPMVTIENGGGDCDDHGPVGASLAILNQLPAVLVVTSEDKKNPGDDDWSHTYEKVYIGPPKQGPSKWIAGDSTLEGDYFGIEAPHRARREFPA